MSKLPRISGNKMIKYIVNRKGFYISSRKGSHVTVHHSDGRWTTVPAKNEELGRGLILVILEDIKIDKDEFVKDYYDGLIK